MTPPIVRAGESIVGAMGFEPGEVIAYEDGGEAVRWCECGHVVRDRHRPAHEARHRRERVVLEASRLTNERGIDYQPGQVWAASPRRKNRRRTGVIR